MTKRRVLVLVATVVLTIAFMASSVMAADKNVATKSFKSAPDNILIAYLTVGPGVKPGTAGTTSQMGGELPKYVPGTGNVGPGGKTQQ